MVPNSFLDLKVNHTVCVKAHPMRIYSSQRADACIILLKGLHFQTLPVPLIFTYTAAYTK